MNGPSWSVELTPRARRDVRNLDQPVRQRVREALERLANDPWEGQLVRLQGSEDLRLRVGDWRVRLRLDRDRHAIVVLRVLPRGRAYRD